MKLFLIPFAGGSSISYAQWKKFFSGSIDVIPIELDGRGIKGELPFYQSFSEAVASVSKEIASYLQPSEEYAIFGHSMGALLAFEVYQERLNKGESLPCALFLSGCKPAFLLETRKVISNLSNWEIKEELRRIGGTPKSVLNSTELMDYFLPIIRADFQILERYCYCSKKKMLNCLVTIFGGTNDKITEDELKQWQALSEQEITLHMFDGDHFFIQYHVLAIATIIEKQMMKYLNTIQENGMLRK